MKTYEEILEEKVEVYEALLHRIQTAHDITLDGDHVRKLLENICKWSYAHRQGNGEYTWDEQQALIDKAFDNLLDSTR